MPFTTRSNPLPLLCRKSYILSQQLRQESGKFLGISPKSQYLCIRIKIHTLIVFFLHICFRLLVSNVAYGVRRDASPFAISTPIKNMGYPCHFSISNQTSLLKKPKIFVDLRNTSYLCTRFAINNGNQRYNNTIN